MILRMSSTRAFGELWLAIVKHEQEFPATVAADEIVRANREPKAARDFLKDFVGGEVAVRVVDGFEVIDIAESMCSRTRAASA